MDEDPNIRDRVSALYGETCSIWVNPWANPTDVARDLRRAAADVEHGLWDDPHPQDGTDGKGSPDGA